MDRQKLSAELRSAFKKSDTRAIRRDGGVPATVYGKHIDESVSIKVMLADLKQCVASGTGSNAVIDLVIEGNGQPRTLPVLVNHIQIDPVSRGVLHVDFHTISMDEKVTASVAVVLLGESPGVKEGGTLDHVHRELTIQALPDNIPPQIEVDISELAIGDSVKIGDLSFPDVVIEGPPDDPVVMIRVSHVHVIEEPEVEGKEETEGAEEAEAESSAEATSESAG